MKLYKRIIRKISPISGKNNVIKGIPFVKYFLFGMGCLKIVGNNNVIICHSKKIGKTKFFIRGNNNKIVIERGVKIQSGTIWIENQGNNIVIGEDTTIEEAHLAVAEDNLSIILGKDCMLSRGVRISTTDSHSIIDNNNQRINMGASVIIGNHVWIGYRSNVNKGVSIGDNSVIASNSLVTHDVPSSVIVAGVPAKVKKTNINWDRKRI